IDIDVQLEYFESSRDIKKTINCEETFASREDIFSELVSLEKKKLLLVSLACIDKVEAFRALERYWKNPDPELKAWAAMAMQESKMLLESSLLDENQIFISTGLGGRGNKLRYFVVFFAKDEFSFDELHKKVINNEMAMLFKKYDAEIEEIKFFETFSTVKAVVPINAQLNNMFEEGIENCNQFGNFLQMNYIVTNVKELTPDEIIKVLENSKLTKGDQAL
ncbi:MAG TPA: hypothetical protein VIH57_14375, partial [Bacteroidales bacterium]